MEKMDNENKLLQLVLDKLDLFEKHYLPINGFYTSKQVQDLLQISDEILGRMRKNGRIEYVLTSDLTYRFPANQPLFSGKTIKAESENKPEPRQRRKRKSTSLTSFL